MTIRTVEDDLRQRLADLISRRDRLNETIENTEDMLARHVKRRETLVRDEDERRAFIAKLTEEERVRHWLMRQPGVGPKTADRLWLSLGGAKGIWEKVRADAALAIKIPWGARDKICAGTIPPWNEEIW